MSARGVIRHALLNDFRDSRSPEYVVDNLMHMLQGEIIDHLLGHLRDAKAGSAYQVNRGLDIAIRIAEEMKEMDIDKIKSPEHETAPPSEADPVIQQETQPHSEQDSD